MRARLDDGDPVAQAADWIARLTADDPDERTTAQIEFARWKAADPRHARAAARVESLLHRLEGLRQHAGGDARPARAALRAAFGNERHGERHDGPHEDVGHGKPSRRRRTARHLGALAAALVTTAVIALSLHAWPPAWLLADLRTGTGQWQTHTLPDGSRLTLNSGSAVDLRYDEGRRMIELIRGEVLVDVARDPARPFVVRTAQADIEALGTRFSVDRDDQRTVLTMLESRVRARATGAHSEPRQAMVSAGERVAVTAAGLGPIERVDADSIEQAWQRHQLIARGEPLPELLDALNRHRPGWIGYDRKQIADVRVFAVLPLDDTEQALQLLANALPAVRVRQLTPYLVWVDAPAGTAE
ncbi:FecR domain-containing protein [Cupriavidus gilardii]|uniref:FecR family protein n=1 Tax=Cupriavidus gilardii TaxID=82541 RepID=UPI0021B2EF40|nr:FecR domain-containing protein [Cupriavidus gilardii]UXC38060.1 FecR domain-containing protein [Cupriavidus gilardii]